jgi:transposase
MACAGAGGPPRRKCGAMQTNELFAAALGLSAPWYVKQADFDIEKNTLIISIDFIKGSRFTYEGVEGAYPAYDTRTNQYRHLNFFQHDCILEVREPRIQIPDGRTVLVKPNWVGKLRGFTLLFEALIMAMCSKMPFDTVAKLTRTSWHCVHAICKEYVELAVGKLDLSGVTMIAIDETSCKRGHEYLMFAADASARKVVFVTQGKDANTIAEFRKFLIEHGGKPEQITSISMDMSKAFIKGVEENFPKARITFDKFHVIAHASKAVDATRRSEQKTDPSLKGLRWALLKNNENLTPSQKADLQVFLATATTGKTASAWRYREQLSEILQCKQINVVMTRLKRWCANVKRSKIDAMKKVAQMILDHFDGIVAWAQTRQTNGFLEALNGLFQAAKRKARGYGNFVTMRIVVYLVAGSLDFTAINPHAKV